MSVVIKSNKYGITLVLDRETPFSELLTQIGEKFKASARFFRGAQMVLAFEGRVLNQEEQMQVLRVIEESSGPEILCVMEQDALKESFMRAALEERQAAQAVSAGRFYKGTLRSGQVLASETCIYIL
ncbi:MAG: septum site-determining protein MinC, partial [Lachnospiraceae bacterium]|nr:septum site-determining protein MinC [Lachnospiraceae bacterium]